jgi:hypothetical protein
MMKTFSVVVFARLAPRALFIYGWRKIISVFPPATRSPAWLPEPRFKIVAKAQKEAPNDDSIQIANLSPNFSSPSPGCCAPFAYLTAF